MNSGAVTRKRVALGVSLFLLAVGVRWLVWQQHEDELNRSMAGLTVAYQADARVLANGAVQDFLRGPAPPGNAQILAHPPGYAVLLAGVYATVGESPAGVRWLQIVVNAASVLLTLFIAWEFFSFRTAALAALLVALSPQLAYNTLLLLPDALAAATLLLAFYCLIRACKQPRVLSFVCVGGLLGVSCWLRANALLLAPFLGVALWFLLPRGRRIAYALAMTGAAMLVIAPVTLRNFVVFHHFIPLSLGSGLNLVEGIADYDKEGRFGLSATDAGVVQAEAQRHNRPDYTTLFNPDGVEREQERGRQGRAVVLAHPFWFATVIARRAVSMLRLERVPANARLANFPEPRSVLVYYLRQPLWLIHRLFITALVLPLALAGLFLLPDRKQKLLWCVVPLYFLCFQSWLHTEYRYFLVINYFLLILAAVALTALPEFLPVHRVVLSLRGILSYNR